MQVFKLGTIIYKVFPLVGDHVWEGTVVDFDPVEGYYGIEYAEDDDWEEMTAQQVQQHLVHPNNA